MTLYTKVLAIDTALNGVSIGVSCADSGWSQQDHLETVRGQAEHLLPMVQKLLKSADLEFKQLDAIVTTIGPGSFTGLRLGLSAAKSLGLALDIPVRGIETLHALSLSYAQKRGEDLEENFAVLVETKRSDFYIQIFDGAALPVTLAQSCELQGVLDLMDEYGCETAIGDALDRLQSQAQAAGLLLPKALQRFDTVKQIDPSMLALYCANGGEFITQDVSPIYLRGADVSKPKSTPRKVAAS